MSARVDPSRLLVEALDEHRGQSALYLEQRAWQLLEEHTVPLGQREAELVE